MNIGQLIADLSMYPAHLEVRVKFWVEDWEEWEDEPSHEEGVTAYRVVFQGSYVTIETE